MLNTVPFPPAVPSAVGGSVESSVRVLDEWGEGLRTVEPGEAVQRFQYANGSDLKNCAGCAARPAAERSSVEIAIGAKIRPASGSKPSGQPFTVQKL